MANSFEGDHGAGKLNRTPTEKDSREEELNEIRNRGRCNGSIPPPPPPPPPLLALRASDCKLNTFPARTNARHPEINRVQIDSPIYTYVYTARFNLTPIFLAYVLVLYVSSRRTLHRLPGKILYRVGGGLTFDPIYRDDSKLLKLRDYK